MLPPGSDMPTYTTTDYEAAFKLRTGICIFFGALFLAALILELALGPDLFEWIFVHLGG